ncbi:MAG: hypothetical protein ABJM06_07235 [Gilvibacter sp.]
MTDSNKPNTMYWIIAVIALIWNIMGVIAYLTQVFMTDELIKMYPTEMQELYADIPSWSTAAMAVGVWFGLLGAICLLIKKKWAYPLFLISFLGVIGSTVYSLFLSGAPEVLDAFNGYIMPILVFVLAIFFIMHSKKSIAKGWLS